MSEIAVTGATGGIGGRVARRLAHRGVAQRLVVRAAGRAPHLPRSTVAVGEYRDGDAMRRAFDGIDTLLLVSAGEAADRLAEHRTAVDAAADAGVRRVVYTSFLNAGPDATFTFARDHHHTEQHLLATGLATVFLRDGLYADFLPGMASGGVIRGPAGDGRVAPVARDDIADVAVAALLDDRWDGAALDLTGPDLVSMAETAALLAEITGAPVRYEDETIAQAYASRASYGAPDWMVTGWVTTYQAIATGELDTRTDTVAEITGRPPTSLRDCLRAVTSRD